MQPNVRDATRAILWAATASAYLNGYVAIEAAYPIPFELAAVKLQVLGHALECSLKGWLILHQAASETDMKRRGHDLAWLASQARPYYQPLAEDEPKKRIVHLTKGYWSDGDRDYQYPVSFKHPAKAPQVAYVPPNELAVFVEECNRALSMAIHNVMPADELDAWDTF
jgi:alkylated DNA repair dioxygenase AlkB